MPTNGSGIKTSLRDKTLTLLQERSVKLKITKIYEDTGLSKTWLFKFYQGKTPNPGVNNIQTLYEYLSKKQLDV